MSDFEVRKIAHYVPMTRQAVEDSAGMRPEIDFLIATGRSRWSWLGRLLTKIRSRKDPLE